MRFILIGLISIPMMGCFHTHATPTETEAKVVTLERELDTLKRQIKVLQKRVKRSRTARK